MLSKIEYSQIRLLGVWAGNDFPALTLASQEQGFLSRPSHVTRPRVCIIFQELSSLPSTPERYEATRQVSRAAGMAER